MKIANSKDLIDNFSDADRSNCRASCKAKLKVNPDGNTKVCLFSDTHIGSVYCNFNAIKKLVKKLLKEKIYVIFGGDIIEGSTRYSIGAGIYEQALNPNQQLFMLLEFFEPLFNEGLVLSVLKGNHEQRFKNSVGLDVASIFAYTNKVPYLGIGGFHFLTAGAQTYSLYYEHGSGGSKMLTSKIKKVIDASKHIENFDIFAWGHVHDLVHWTELRRTYNRKRRRLETREKLFLITGHYINYEDSYANDCSMPPTRQGSPILILNSKEKKADVEYFYAN